MPALLQPAHWAAEEAAGGVTEQHLRQLTQQRAAVAAAHPHGIGARVEGTHRRCATGLRHIARAEQVEGLRQATGQQRLQQPLFLAGERMQGHGARLAAKRRRPASRRAGRG
jgi:hypothetical protein